VEQSISDDQWHELLLTIGELRGGADLAKARIEVEQALHDYYGLRRDPAKLKDARATWEAIKRSTVKLHVALAGEWSRRRVRKDFLVHLGLRRLIRRSMSLLEAFDMPIAAHKGSISPALANLYLRLLEIWQDEFRGELRSAGSTTGGPAVRFVRTVLAIAGVERTPGSIRITIRNVLQGKGVGVFRPVAKSDPNKPRPPRPPRSPWKLPRKRVWCVPGRVKPDRQ